MDPSLIKLQWQASESIYVFVIEFLVQPRDARYEFNVV